MTKWKQSGDPALAASWEDFYLKVSLLSGHRYQEILDMEQPHCCEPAMPAANHRHSILPKFSANPDCMGCPLLVPWRSFSHHFNHPLTGLHSITATWVPAPSTKGMYICTPAWLKGRFLSALGEPWMGTSSKPQLPLKHAELEGTHQNQVQFLALLYRTPQESHPLPESIVQALRHNTLELCQAWSCDHFPGEPTQPPPGWRALS